MKKKSGINDRKRTRIQGQYDGFLIIAGETLPMTTTNVSLSGLLCNIEGERVFPVGLPCEVELPLAAGLTIRAKASVARSDHEGTAVDFTGIDPDSYGHLLNIVRFMSADPDSIDAEQTKPLFIDRPFKPDL